MGISRLGLVEQLRESEASSLPGGSRPDDPPVPYLTTFGGLMDKPALHAFMLRSRYGVVSSLAADGTPQSALVGIAVTPDLEVVFDTLRTTRKYANLMARPACSVVLWWGGEQTVQLDGIGIEPSGNRLEFYREAYFRAWPDGRDRLAWPGIVHLVVEPKWIRAVDYDRSPPLLEEFRCPE
ncbi:MAG TPA: pyridoxamine 5'-phosphate oxidase family protein [Terracidiphilus sp.]|jgi:pyridoxine/pyridoxamine 5'-phosphate oxidase